MAAVGTPAGMGLRLRAGEADERLNVLIVGIDGIGKRALGEAVVEAAKQADQELDVMIASNISHKEPITGRVDYLVVMVDMKSKLSLERLYESFPHVGVEYSLARACMVILNSETPALFSFSLDEVAQFASAHSMHVMYCTDDPRSVRTTASSIIKACSSTTRPCGVSPLFMSTLDVL